MGTQLDQEKLKAMAAELAKDIKSEKDLGALTQQLVKLTVETALNAELDEHLGYEKHAPEGRGTGNSRNGYSAADISATLVSKVTERVIDQVHEWQNRPVDPIYPIVYLDCIVLKIRQDKRVINKSLYLALGINMEGQKELLGLWLAETEGAKFWLSVLTELKNRGLEDILIACVDGLKGFPDAIAAEYPQTKIQLCIVHMVRNSLRYVSWKDYRAVTADLKQIYQSATEHEARQALEAFGERWDSQYPQISRSWHSHWDNTCNGVGSYTDLFTGSKAQQLADIIKLKHQDIKKLQLENSKAAGWTRWGTVGTVSFGLLSLALSIYTIST